MSTIFEKLLSDIPRMSFHNTQICIQSVVFNVFQQVMLDQLRKYVTGENLDAQIAKIFDTNAATEGFSKSVPA